MGIFDLLLIATVLSTLGGIVIAIVLWVRGLCRNATRILLVLGGYLAVYTIALVATSIFSPRKQMSIGDQQCFDDWCLRVVDVTYEIELTTSPRRTDAVFAVVTAEVSNRGRGRAQSEPKTFLYIVDDQGRTYRQSIQAQGEYERVHGTTPLLTSMVSAGESIICKQVFELPRDALHPELIVGHPTGPGLFVIGDSESFFHRKNVVSLPDLLLR